MRSIVWWTVWGLVMAVGAIGLLEFHRSHYFLVLSIPLLTGAIAAAVHRLEHEYRHAIEHAKWAGVSAVFLLAAVGFLYLKAHAIGPFTTGTPHKALLGTTFGMSVPEVERTLGRKLRVNPAEGALQEKAHEWLAEALPLPRERSDESYSLPVNVFGARSRITFHFDKRRLARVELQFMPARSEEATRIRLKILEELSKDYKLTEESTKEELSRYRYAKESVDALLIAGEGSDKLTNIRVVLDYIPTEEQAPAPLAAESNVF